MKSYAQGGFTIVELILFLGITGALFAALMIGVNSSLAQQRYKDSVASYKTLFEDQYSEVAHPANERDDNWSCSATDGVQVAPSGVGQPRGTSGCVLLGRYLRVTERGQSAEVGSVIGIEPDDTSGFSSDVAILAAYKPRLSPIGKETHEIEWQSTLETPEGLPSDASFLILRSPLSGLVRTFALSDPLPDDLVSLADFVTEQNATRTVKNCVVSNGKVGVPTESITVEAAIASSNGVVLNGNDIQC